MYDVQGLYVRYGVRGLSLNDREFACKDNHFF